MDAHVRRRAGLEMRDQRYETARAGVGSAGASVWRFIARKTGHTRLELKQLRPWDPSDSAAERFSVDLEVLD